MQLRRRATGLCFGAKSFDAAKVGASWLMATIPLLPRTHTTWGQIFGGTISPFYFGGHGWAGANYPTAHSTICVMSLHLCD